MRVLSSAFYDRLKADKRHYYHILNFSFKDGSNREIRDDQIWGGGISFDDAVSSDSNFDLGSVIIGKCNIQLNNLYDDFPKSLVFEGAKVVVKLGVYLDDLHAETETLIIGEYTVASASYTGAIIQLECLDNLHKFDKSYTTDITFPAKIKDIFYDSCSKCGLVPQELNDSDINVVPDRGYNPESFYWTQLYNPVSGASSSYAGILVKTNSIGCTVTGTASFDGGISLPRSGNISFTVGHVYAYYGLPNVTGFRLMVPASSAEIIDQSDNAVIFKAKSSSVSMYIYFVGDAVADFEFNAKVTDLTALTGAGSEPRSVNSDEIKFINRYGGKHPSYNAGATVQNDLYEPPAGIGDYYDYIVTLDPDKRDNLTHRQVVSYLAQICGRFVKVNSAGYPGMGWYRFARMYDAESDIGSDSFDERTRRVHKLTDIGSLSVGIDPIVITGVRITGRHKVTVNGNEEEQDFSKLAGSEGYVITIADNPFIRTPADADYILGWLGPDLIGKTFCKANVSHLSNPAIESGDVAYARDRKGNYYPILISSTKFTTGQMQTSVSAAADPIRNSAEKNSALAKTYTDLLQRIDREKNSRELAIENLNNRVGEGVGLYATTKTDVDGGTILYLHDKKKLDESGTVWIVSKSAMAVTTNPSITIVDGAITDASTYQYGFTSNGDLLANLIDAITINVDRIHLYGDMTVYTNRDDNVSGGKFGYGLGRSGWGTTKGIHMLSINGLAEVIATTDGARVSYGDYSSVLAMDKTVQMRFEDASRNCEYFFRASDRGYAELVQQKLDNTGKQTTVYVNSSGANLRCNDLDSGNRSVVFAESGLVGFHIGNTSETLNQSYKKNNITLDANGANIKTEKTVTIDGSSVEVSGGGIDITKRGTSGKIYINSGNDLQLNADAACNITSKSASIGGTNGLSLNSNSAISENINGSQKAYIDAYTTRLAYDYNDITGTGTFFYAGYRASDGVISAKMVSGSNNFWVKSGGSGPQGGSTGYGWTSDRRMKHDIRYDIDGDLVDLLKPASFKMNGTEWETYGFIAQDVQEVIPNLITDSPEEEGRESHLGLNYLGLIPFLTAKIQKQDSMIKSQQKQIDDLEKRLARLEAMINA